MHLLGTEFRFAPGQALLTRVVRGGAIGEPRLATFLLHIPLLADPDAEVPPWWSDADPGRRLARRARVARDRPGPHHARRVREREREPAERRRPPVDRRGRVPRALPAARRVRRRSCRASRPIAGRCCSRRVSRERSGTAWAEGDRVIVADADGTREIEVPARSRGRRRRSAARRPASQRVRPAALDRHRRRAVHAPLRSASAPASKATTGSLDPAPATFADGVATMEVLDAIRRSAREGASVDLAR